MASSSAYLSKQMRTQCLLVVLLSLSLPSCRSLAAEELQTEWQKHVFEEVEATATNLSEAAVPVLLARLDSPLFRAELSKCCPSFSDLSSPQLLQKLQEKVAVTEIVSGFPSAERGDITPDAPGMSVEDGLNGSFFQNVWQMVLLDAKNPDSVFHQLDMEYAKVSCDLERRTASMERWQSGCSNHSGYKMSYSLDACMKDASSGMIVQCKCAGNTFKMKYWSLTKSMKQSGNRLKLLLSAPAANVTCPQRPADGSLSYTADATCHGYVRENASNAWIFQDDAETRQYGLKPFENAGAPKTLAEAAERGPYTLVNNFLLDAGSPLYGDVSAVFSNQVLRKTALLSAVDSGFYEGACVAGQPHFFGLACNCSVLKPFKHLGTLEHFNHLFLLNEDFWSGSSTLLGHFRRLEGRWGSQLMASRDMLHYWEALPAGNLHYPEAVRFLIASYPSLFGSPRGALVKEWARQRGWILLWSLGPNMGGDTSGIMNFGLISKNWSIAANQRMVDPEVAVHTTAAANLELPEVSLTRFRSLWSEVGTLRKSAQSVSNITMAVQWQKLATALPDLLLQPLRTSEDCKRPPDAPECVGVTFSGGCVCYAQAADPHAIMV